VVRNIENMGKQFIAGTTPPEAVSVLALIRGQGLAFSVDLLGEAVVSEEEAVAYMEWYGELLDVLNEAENDWETLGGVNGDMDWGHAPKINVSVKPSAMYSLQNPRAFDHCVVRAKERLGPVLRKAVSAGAHLCLDMEQLNRHL
jgi:RHH-type proline utilization regulon transcriptional repressor/proline dehydrogenase/delta 1-pyrroline-5-carboxylate dehydrogenase